MNKSREESVSIKVNVYMLMGGFVSLPAIVSGVVNFIIYELNLNTLLSDRFHKTCHLTDNIDALRENEPQTF